MIPRLRPVLSRRQLLACTASSIALAGTASLTKPYLSRAADRPLISGGIQSGDIDAASALVWARADRPARVRVECATSDSFKTVLCAVSTSR
jgi:alkaline phosphatase D